MTLQDRKKEIEEINKKLAVIGVLPFRNCVALE